MNRWLVGLSLLAAPVIGPALLAQQPELPACEPGYTYVCQTEYKQVEKYVCKLESYVKKTKKWCYTTKDSPFCIHKDHAHLCCPCDPPACLGPFDRQLLVKKEIVVKEEPATRCVTEKVVTVVPCTVWRKVRIGEAVQPPAVRAPAVDKSRAQPPAPPAPVVPPGATSFK